MVSDNESTIEDLLTDAPEDISVPAFRPEEMVPCPTCSRKNAPNRRQCLYCGAELGTGSNFAQKPEDRHLESWEKGFNAVVTGGKLTGSAGTLTAELSVDVKIIDAVSKGITGFPICRSGTLAEAGQVKQILTKSGIESAIVADDDLALESAPVRIRGLELSTDSLTLRLFNSNDERTFQYAQIALIVAGTIYESKTQSIEQRSRGETKILDESQASSRETIVDIYTLDDAIGYRIYPRGFDFSCLADEKTLLAADNITKLITKLRDVTAALQFSDEYDRMRDIFDIVWEIDTKRESLGLQKSGFGKPGLGKAATASNAGQFTRYSRMRRHLL